MAGNILRVDFVINKVVTDENVPFPNEASFSEIINSLLTSLVRSVL